MVSKGQTTTGKRHVFTPTIGISADRPAVRAMFMARRHHTVIFHVDRGRGGQMYTTCGSILTDAHGVCLLTSILVVPWV